MKIAEIVILESFSSMVNAPDASNDSYESLRDLQNNKKFIKVFPEFF